MLRALLWIILMVVYTLILGLIPLLWVKILKLLKKDQAADKTVDKLARIWGKGFFMLSGSKVKVIGAENVPREGAILFVSNHQSLFDIALFLGYVPRGKGFIAKIEIKKIPLVASWMRYMYCVFLDRGNVRQAVHVIRETVSLLEKGKCLVIFPEGTRSRDGKIKSFSRASMSMAVKAKAPIIPVCIKDSYKITEGSKKLRITPAEVEIRIFPPILPQPERTDLELTNQVHRLIAESLEQ